MSKPANRGRDGIKQQPKQEKERCMICKDVMDSVSAPHLRQHGYTLERYHRTYGATRPPSIATRSGSLTDPTARMDLVNAVAERLVSDKVWLACISDEVGERMLNGPLRQRLSWMLTTMLAQRAQVHGEALAVLSGALVELKEDWRATQGGDGGGPTDTATLLGMVEKAGKLVKESEEAVQRTIKLALEEQRAESQWADTAGPTLYRGDAERLDMPASVTTGDREVIRNLIAMVGKHAERAGTLDATAGAGTHAQVPRESNPAPGDVAMGNSRPNDGQLTVRSGLPMANDGVVDASAGTCGSVSDPTSPLRRSLHRGTPSPGSPSPPAGGADDEGGINDSSRGTLHTGGSPGGATNSYGNLSASDARRPDDVNSCGNLPASDAPPADDALSVSIDDPDEAPARKPKRKAKREPIDPPRVSLWCKATTKRGTNCKGQCVGGAGKDRGYCSRHGKMREAKRQERRGRG